MTQKQINQGNKLIAESNGWIIEPGMEKERVSQMRFHNSWEWIMPIAEKVLSTKWLEPGTGEDHGYYHFVTFGMHNETTGQIMVRISGFGLHEADTLIEALWLALVEFTEYHKSPD